MAYWLFKSEPDVFGIEDLKACKNQTEPWDGIRNYQARNFLRDTIKTGDRVLFYHSRCQPPGIVGTATVVSDGYPDPTQFDPEAKYYDAKSDPENPRWYLVDVKLDAIWPGIVSLADLKANPELVEMKVVQRGQRLSIQPVTADEWDEVHKMAGVKG